MQSAPTKTARRSVALVIGSGSVKCAAAIGMHRVLLREGIKVNLIVGCSAGSMFGALIALGLSPEESKNYAEKLWTRRLTERKNRRGLLSVLFPKWFGFTEEKFGLVHDRLIMQALIEAFGDRTFADTQIPFFVTATDFHSGEQVTLDSGLLRDAMRASISIPFTFSPWRIGNRLYIDGFMSDPLPVGVAIRNSADIILAMGFESPHQTRISNAGRFAFQMSSIMTNNLLKAKFAFHTAVHHAEVIPILPKFEQRIRLFDTEKIPYIIEEGAKATEAQLPYLVKLLEATVPIT